MDTIKLKDIWRPDSLLDYKVHFARFNGDTQPFAVLASDMGEWQKWQETYPSQDAFNRRYVFSLAQLPDAPDLWMFGGVWTIEGTEIREDGKKYYQVALDDQLGALVSRLKLHRVHKQRGTRLNLEKHYDAFVVSEILAERYTGRRFPGYNNVDLEFEELKMLIRHGREDWRTALSHMKGIYLLTDTQTYNRYVGSAYGEFGIWSRWCEYIATGHGSNKELRRFLCDKPADYHLKNFKISLLEVHRFQTNDSEIIERESFWKRVFLSKGHEGGWNRN